MKCPKCSFVSFDYLSECKKCGANLAGTREALGFTGNKPAIPFFLGSLLKEGAPGVSNSEKDAPEDDLSSFDFNEEITVPDLLDESPEPDYEPEAGVASGEHDSEDFNLLDLSDEELDLLIADSESEKQGIPDKPEEGLAASTEQMVRDQVPTFEPQFAEDTGKSAAVAPARSGEDESDSLQIELSDKDLELLLAELENSSRKKEKKNGGSDAE